MFTRKKCRIYCALVNGEVGIVVPNDRTSDKHSSAKGNPLLFDGKYVFILYKYLWIGCSQPFLSAVFNS
jgi:hypothetical protein